MVKDVRWLWGVHYAIILAGKRISPQNEDEGMDSDIHYILKMFKLRWLKIITRFTKYLSHSCFEVCIDYSSGSWVSPAKGGQLLLSVAVAHQAFEKVTEPWDPVHYYERMFGVFLWIKWFQFSWQQTAMFSLCRVQLSLSSLPNIYFIPKYVTTEQ